MLIDRLNKNVRFKAQTYTDRGPTIKFKYEYNLRKFGYDEIIFPITLKPLLCLYSTLLTNFK